MNLKNELFNKKHTNNYKKMFCIKNEENLIKNNQNKKILNIKNEKKLNENKKNKKIFNIKKEEKLTKNNQLTKEQIIKLYDFFENNSDGTILQKFQKIKNDPLFYEISINQIQRYQCK